MPDKFTVTVPSEDGTSTTLELKMGETLYLLGANGTGKSSLVSHIFRQNVNHASRVSAHRQTWFESNALDMTPRSRLDMENNFRSQDSQVQARYKDWNPAGRSGVAIYDLIDADTMQERKIAALVRKGDDVQAKAEASNPSPIQVINELMRLSNLSIEISLADMQQVVAQKSGGAKFSIAELSDGERNAFLIASTVLTAKPGTLILIDEPERHLHRSIITPLLRLLFDRRKDCSFIVSTHEYMLPVDDPAATTMLVRGCTYKNANPSAWIVDILPSGGSIDEDLKKDLLGSRRKILFVEGTSASLDAPLYSLLFPQVSVVSKESCRDVELAVKGLRTTPDIHWVAAWGIIDNDQRTDEDVRKLREGGVYALKYYSVESLYYLSEVVSHVAARQAKLTGTDATDRVKKAIEDAIAAAKAQRNHLVGSAVHRAVRNAVFHVLPSRDDVDRGAPITITIDVAAVRAQEEARFDALIQSGDWDGLLSRYPLRESTAFGRIVSAIKVADRETYEASVLKLLQEDLELLSSLRSMFGDLYQVAGG